MALPVHPNQICLSDIQTEFGGTNPICLDEYYAGGSYVPAGTIGYPNGVATSIPTSGQICLNNFHGASKSIVYTMQGGPVQALNIPAGTWYVTTRMVGGGGGGGAGDENRYGSFGGDGGSIEAKFVITSGSAQTLVATSGLGGGGGLGRSSNGSTPGGYPGRASSFATTSGSIATETPGWYVPTDVFATWEGNFKLVPAWHPNFDSLGLNARVPVSVYFPYVGNYTFTGASDDRFRLYIGPSQTLLGNFDGYSTLKSTTVYIGTPGWYTLWFAADNSGGGAKGIGLLVAHNNTGQSVFRTLELAGGGIISGTYWYLNGGGGGNSGNSGFSGSGGGEGGATGLLWYPQGNPYTSENYQVLAIAPGGGGGAGTGRYDFTGSSPKTSNWNNRGATTSWSTIINSGTANLSSTWFSQPAGSRIPYVNINIMQGQGPSNSFWYGPMNTLNVQWDGGGGGGGGAPWGIPGGYAERSGSIWSSNTDKSGNTIWYGPLESAGAGGSQGFLFINGSYASAYQFAYDASYWSPSSIAGVGGFGAAVGTGRAGWDGAYMVRVSNVDDNVYPV